MKLIYLQLYKDTYSIFMQAYKPLKSILNYSKNLRKEEYFTLLNLEYLIILNFIGLI